MGTPSKVMANLFGINEPQQRTFIPLGGPQDHGNSKPPQRSMSDMAINCKKYQLIYDTRTVKLPCHYGG